MRKQNYIFEKSKDINIKNLVQIKNKNKLSQEYSKREDFFDPNNHSPPNSFMYKLQNRLTNYCSLDIK
jgi:hypothetical protein